MRVLLFGFKSVRERYFEILGTFDNVNSIDVVTRQNINNMTNSKVIEYIPKDEFYDMPTLFEELIKDNEKTISFPLREYWLDIGRMEEYERANSEYSEVF